METFISIDSFSSIHSYAYSVIALQELNIYYHYGPVYWNVGCLSTEAIGDEEGSGNGTDYGAISKAIYKMKAHGVEVLPPDINNAELDFGCDPKAQCIYFGLGAIAGINNETAQQIIDNRPYSSFEDFLDKNDYIDSNITKSKVITLIKAGCFDCFDKNRVRVMKNYTVYCNAPKKCLALANITEATKIGVKIPHEILAPYNFKKYVCSKQFCCGTHPNFRSKKVYWLDEKAIRYFNEKCKDKLQEGVDYWEEEDRTVVVDKSIEKLFKGEFDKLKEYLNNPEVVNEYNKCLWRSKYAETIGESNPNKWSFEALSYYSPEHELADVDFYRYNITPYSELPEDPVFVDKTWGKRSFKQYEISQICGTVIDKNDMKHYFTLLTPDNHVVNVKMNQAVYAKYKSQISEFDENGKKKVMDKSWLSRGCLVIVTGYRKGDEFFSKRYSRSIFQHSLMRIERVNPDGSLDIQSTRYGFDEDTQ